MLDTLGVYGFGPIEDGFLAGLALGEPILLVGNIGSAKTMLAERIARALGLRFHAYDASKAVFEDVLGFPDPRVMQEGRVEYLPSPITLWDKEFILVDELSRAMPGMQNKWLEVIQSRRIMGVPLPHLRHVVAAMNPAGLLGTIPLDAALAGRFTFVLDVPDVHEFSEEERRRVITNASPPLGDGRGEDASSSPRIVDLLDATRQALPGVQKEIGRQVTTYLDAVREHLLFREANLDGRRLGMMYRAITALLALHRASGHVTERSVPLDLLRHALDLTLPFRAMGVEVPRTILNAAHAHALAALQGHRRPLLGGSQYVHQVQGFIAGDPAWGDQAVSSQLVARLATALDRPARVEATIEAAMALLCLMARPDCHARLSPDARQRLWTCFRDATSLSPEQVSDFAGRAATLDIEFEGPDRLRGLVLRMAYQLAEKLDHQPSIHCEFEDLASRLVAEVMEGGVA